MMLTSLILAAAPAAQGPGVEWSAPENFVTGRPYFATVTLELPDGGADVPAWRLSPAAFSVDGEPLGERGDAAVSFAGGGTIELRLDLAPYLAELGSEFEIGHASGGDAVSVRRLEGAAEGLDFMQVPAGELDEYRVVLETNRGTMVAELWPETAPQHVRNFLDLAYTGFYDGTTFHRVISDFMIQGGDPTGSGMGQGPRTLKAEFSDREHVRGVLSMARGPSPDSASCQFFIVREDSTHLDGQYSAFGRLVSGLEVVDAIADTPRGRQDRPTEEQVIERAIVVRAAPAKGDE